MKEEITQKIRDFFKVNQGSTDDIAVWETFKVYIRGALISLSAARKKAKNLVRQELLQQIKDLDQKQSQVLI